ncbi:unnamed protein product [Brachionus calyciflorus]|uniref:Uncharacterized protein n=1 Tax=Brachionus calyciflorus TaxID=104777 RepID=A0A813ZBM4_9BILA|nr:unnamed protein product [Brachionus calyciflorus]
MEKLENLKEKNPKVYIGTIICFIILIIFMTAYPIAMIAVGATNLNKCTIEPKIPVWLIVSGSVSIFMAFLMAISLISQAVLKRAAIVGIFSCITCVVSLFQLAWFITGNVWVYSKNGSVIYDIETSPNYCDKTLYLFSFWTITVAYIMMGLSIIISIFMVCCACVCTACCFAKAK